MAPAAFRTVQVTVIGRASANESFVEDASLSLSCGKKIDLELVKARRAPTSATVRSTAAPVLPATSRGASRKV